MKLALTERALHSNYTRKRLHRVSIHQFVNRLLLLFQKPRIFLFYRKTDKGWQYVFSTYRDVLYLNHFRETVLSPLHNSLDNEDIRLYSPPNQTEWPNEPLAIKADNTISTGYGVVMISAENRGMDGRVLFSSACKEDYVLLKEFWSRFLGAEYSRDLGVAERLRKQLDTITHEPGADGVMVHSLSEKDVAWDNEKEDEKFISSQLNILTSIMEDLYKGVCETPLVCNKGRTPPNLFFFLRYYGAPEHNNRFKNGVLSDSCSNENKPYPYSLKMIIPPTQKQHLMEMLENIRTFTRYAKDSDRWEYKYTRLKQFQDIFLEPPVEEHERFRNRNWDKQFWEDIKEGENGFERIINDLQEPYGKGARSIVDSALMSGYTHYRSGIFSHSGSERIIKDIADRGSDSVDVRRMVNLHYVLSSTSQKSTVDTLGTMSVPLHVASQAYMAIAQATVLEADDESICEGGKFRVWPRNYHFFTDVGRYCVRGLRYRVKHEYREQLKEQVILVFKEVIDRDERLLGEVRDRVCNELNRRFKLLCRVWPYPLVKVEFGGVVSASQLKKNQMIAFNTGNKGLVLTYSVDNNPEVDPIHQTSLQPI